jgi:hypothetical protein
MSNPDDLRIFVYDHLAANGFPPTLSEVDQISRTVAHDIRNQYAITYAPTTPKTVPGFRTVRVDARAKPYKKLSVRTRAGYYPGQEH